MQADDSHEDEKEKIRERQRREGGTCRSDGLRSMQFSRGSIKALGAISGCLNKAIVALGVSSCRPISCLTLSAAPLPSRDFTCEFNLPFS